MLRCHAGMTGKELMHATGLVNGAILPRDATCNVQQALP